MADALGTADPAYPIVSAILKVVPASRWSFARVTAEGEAEKLLSSDAASADLGELGSEFRRQRRASKSGSRIASVLGTRARYENGITLLFADARSTFGILTLQRSADLGAFTSTEISMLTLALDATSERLSVLRLHPDDGGSHAPIPMPAVRRDVSPVEDVDGSFYVLDRDLQIVLAWDAEDRRRVALTDLRTRLADRLPAVLEDSVRELTAGWNVDARERGVGQARPVPFLVVRTAPMAGPTGLFIGVRIDREPAPNPLASAATKYHISPREVQVLALLLDGDHLSEIREPAAHHVVHRARPHPQHGREDRQPES